MALNADAAWAVTFYAQHTARMLHHLFHNNLHIHVIDPVDLNVATATRTEKDVAL